MVATYHGLQNFTSYKISFNVPQLMVDNGTLVVFFNLYVYKN
jgi:hypothetical protein